MALFPAVDSLQAAKAKRLSALANSIRNRINSTLSLKVVSSLDNKIWPAKLLFFVQQLSERVGVISFHNFPLGRHLSESRRQLVARSIGPKAREDASPMARNVLGGCEWQVDKGAHDYGIRNDQALSPANNS